MCVALKHDSDPDSLVSKSTPTISALFTYGVETTQPNSHNQMEIVLAHVHLC